MSPSVVACLLVCFFSCLLFCSFAHLSFSCSLVCLFACLLYQINTAVVGQPQAAEPTVRGSTGRFDVPCFDVLTHVTSSYSRARVRPGVSKRRNGFAVCSFAELMRWYQASWHCSTCGRAARGGVLGAPSSMGNPASTNFPA